MTSKPDDLPSDLVSALAALRAEREARLRAEAMAASAQAELSDNAALIAHLELRIEKLKRELHGQRSERTARLIEQLELELEELVTTASEDELAAQAAAAKTQNVRPFMRSGRFARHGRTTSNTSAWSLRLQRVAPAAVDLGWRRSERMSPRRWRRSRVASR
jgi:hypothetical protein